MASVGAAAAASRYASTAAAGAGLGDSGASANALGSFGQALQDAMSGTIRTAKEADRLATSAIAGEADVTAVVTAVARAELALQTTVAIRDRVIQAYQDVMRMPI
ncbi:MAG: flagellar hook-basal body complex protein FliE [Acetobacteraceae bacterium]